MNIKQATIILFLILIFVIVINKIVVFISNTIRKKNLFNNINEWSYKRFSRFFGKLELNDKEFEKKLKKIWELIVIEKEEDIENIALLSNCTIDECLLKIKYLENKRKIENYYIDVTEKTIKYCTPKDKKLLEKYSPYIYKLHLQPIEIALRLPEATNDNLESIENKVIEELCYLDRKYMINGINIDKVDKKIIYYTIEKHKNEKDYITIACSNCGAVNDVPRMGKARCNYCATIVEDKIKNT